MFPGCHTGQGPCSVTRWTALFGVTIRGNTAVPEAGPLGCKGQAHNVKQAVKSLQPLFSLYTLLQLFLSLPKCWQRSNVPLFTLSQLHFIHPLETETRSVKYSLGSGHDPHFCSPGRQARPEINSPTATSQRESLNCDVSTGARLAGSPGHGGVEEGPTKEPRLPEMWQTGTGPIDVDRGHKPVTGLRAVWWSPRPRAPAREVPAASQKQLPCQRCLDSHTISALYQVGVKAKLLQQRAPTSQ